MVKGLGVFSGSFMISLRSVLSFILEGFSSRVVSSLMVRPAISNRQLTIAPLKDLVTVHLLRTITLCVKAAIPPFWVLYTFWVLKVFWLLVVF